jgi:predicted nucleic acid-binding protein
MRVVFDTNTVISALLFRGAASWLVEHWQRDEVTPLLNHQIAHELLQVLAYPKFGLTSAQVDSIATRYLCYAERVEQNENRADLLVTGDKDLLELRGATPFIIETLAEYRSRFR